VQEAVTTYCATRDECRGPVGPQGEQGLRGGDGRGITALACDSTTPLELTVTYTDGTTETYSCGGGPA